MNRGSAKRSVVITGILGRYPFAGIAWQIMHYIEGFRRLGHEVYYLEDTGEWPFDPEQLSITGDCSFTARYIARVMNQCGMDGRWAYRSAADDGEYYGLSRSAVGRLLERTDALINLCGATVLRSEHIRVPIRVYLETDPVRPQIEIAQGAKFTADMLAAHTHRFTFGENIGRPDCRVPCEGLDYVPTRQPVVLEWWEPGSTENNRFTTIANWRQSGKDIDWNGTTLTWSKHFEFLKFIALPRSIAGDLELALSELDDASRAELAENDWRVRDAFTLSRDLLCYRDYISGSRGEFTVAKDQNVRLLSGWFSDRSACYLAAGRPVITQETGFSSVLPTGRGLFGFKTMEDIREAWDSIDRDYELHRVAAREIADQYFRAEKVVGRMAAEIGL